MSLNGRYGLFFRSIALVETEKKLCSAQDYANFNPMKTWHFFKEGGLLALGALAANRTRTLLTMIGMATGIFAITAILTMINSLEVFITQNLSELGNTTLFVHHFPWRDNSGDWYKLVNRPKIDYQDYQRLHQNLTQVSGVSFQASAGNQTVRGEGRSMTGIELAGITEDADRIAAPDILKGRFLSRIEITRARPVCVIGFEVAQGIFKDKDPLGQYVRIAGKRLLVAGVLAREGTQLFSGGSSDYRVLVPYKLLAGMFDVEKRGLEAVISVRAETYESVPWVESEIKGIMRVSRGLKPSEEDNFAINKQEALMAQFDNIFGFLRTGGWIISIFSILIGGFSIGNIMYIAVKERTNEIGVQKALGATERFIAFQFLTEAVLVCILGGLLGMAFVFMLGEAGQLILKSAGTDFRVVYAAEDLAIGLGLSTFIGLIAGFTPATMAAKLDPVEAIRQA